MDGQVDQQALQRAREHLARSTARQRPRPGRPATHEHDLDAGLSREQLCDEHWEQRMTTIRPLAQQRARYH
jgi:hypothetical protein